MKLSQRGHKNSSMPIGDKKLAVYGIRKSIRVFPALFLAGHDSSSSSSHLAVKCGTRLDIANNHATFLISNFRRVLSIVCNLLGISPASDY